MSRNSVRVRSVLATLAALVAVASFAGWGCSKKSSPTAAGTQTLASQNLSIRNASDVEHVMKVQNENSGRLMAIDGVIGTGTGALADGRPAILVLAKHDGLAGVPEQIDGIAVDTRVIGEVTAYAKPGGGTLQCGTSTGNDLECAAGTIGCVVLRSGTRYFLSNNHVFARENAAHNGERIDAPGRYDGHPRCAQTPICGTLADFQPISFSSNNTIDCAIALPDPGRPFTGAEAAGYTPSSTVVSPSVGLAVKKDGRTSGLTTGSIQAINVTIQVQYSSGGIATFVNQIMTPANFIRSGDSGSLMVTQSGNNPVGLCFAGGSGGSFANPIGPVLQRFNATVSP